MVTFAKKSIAHNYELIARELSQTRTDKKIDLKKAAQKTGISQKYLEAMEAGKFEKLPPGVYSKNFLKEYAIFLGLNANVLLELYIEDANGSSEEEKQKFFFNKIPSIISTVNFPRIIKVSSVAIITIVCFFYLGIYIKKIITPPSLVLLEPSANLVVNNNLIEFSGYSDPNAQIKINDELVLTDPNGNFAKGINLKDGLNTITVTAQKKYSKKSEIIRKIYVESEQKP